MFEKSPVISAFVGGVRELVVKLLTVREPQIPMTLNLINFNDPKVLDQLIVRSDQELDGYSTAYLDQKFENRRGYGVFHGILNLDPPLNNPKVVRSGWSMFRTKHKNNFDHRISYFSDTFGNFKWDLSPYSAIALRVKSDHRKYFVNIQIDDIQKNHLFQHRLFVQKLGQWEDVYIPLDDFVLTNKGVLMERNRSELNREKVKSIGIGLLDRTYGPYELCIESIRLITDDDLVKLVNRSRYENVELPQEQKMSIE